MKLNTKKLRFEDWPKIKPLVTFNYTTLRYDTDPTALKEAIKHSQEIETIILEQSDSFWHRYFQSDQDYQFTHTHFLFKNVHVWARVWEGSLRCQLDLESVAYRQQCEKLAYQIFQPSTPFFGARSFDIPKLIENLDNLTLDKLTFLQPNKTIDTTKIADAVGRGLDPGIKSLVQLLNDLGIYTTASCEGHRERNHTYPWVDIEMLSLPKLLYLIKVLNKKQLLSLKISANAFQIRLQSPQNLSLKQAQNLFKQLEKAINAQINS